MTKVKKIQKSQKGESKGAAGNFRTVLNPNEAGPKRKLLPRGRPFEKGNTLSLPYRFKKGAPSPNPGGRPKCRELSVAIRQALAMDSSKPLPMRTNAEVMAAKVITKGRKGKLPYIREAADRSEGKAPVSIITQGEDNLKLLVFGMDEMYSQLGRPEGMEPLPALPLGETEGDEQIETQEAT